MTLKYKVTIHPGTDLSLAVAAAQALVNAQVPGEAAKTGVYNSKVYEDQEGHRVQVYITSAQTPSIIVKDATQDADEAKAADDVPVPDGVDTPAYPPSIEGKEA